MSNLSLDYHKVTPSMLEHTMDHFGWSKIKSFPNQRAVWASSTGDVKQWLPLSQQFDDYDQIVTQAIDSISKNSQVSVSDVDLYINQFFNNKDLVQIRIDADDVQTGRIEFDDGVNLFGAFKQIVKVAVREVVGTIKDAKESFLEQCELGQTAVGSYVINAYLPVYCEIEQSDTGQRDMDVGSSDLGRKINLTLINRLAQLNSIIADYSSENSIQIVHKLLSLGYTKTECEAVETLFGKKGERNWEVSVLWSKAIETDVNQVSFVRFDKSTSANVHSITKSLKHTSSKKKQKLEGRVVQLSRDYGQNSGKIAFKTIWQDKEVKIDVMLNDEDYEIATKAHSTKLNISIIGDLNIIDKGKNSTYVVNHVEKLEKVQYTLPNF